MGSVFDNTQGHKMILWICLFMCLLITHTSQARRGARRGINGNATRQTTPDEPTRKTTPDEPTPESTLESSIGDVPETTSALATTISSTPVPTDDTKWYMEMAGIATIGAVGFVVILALVILLVACCSRRKRRLKARTSGNPQVVEPEQSLDQESTKDEHRVSQDDTYLIVLPDEPVSETGSTHSAGSPSSPGGGGQLYVNVPDGTDHSPRITSLCHPAPPKSHMDLEEEAGGEMEYDYPTVRFGLHQPNSKNAKESSQLQKSSSDGKEQKDRVSNLKTDTRRPPAIPSPHQDTYSPMYVVRNEQRGVHFPNEARRTGVQSPRGSDSSSPVPKKREDPLKKLAAVMNKKPPVKIPVKAPKPKREVVYQNSEVSSVGDESKNKTNQGLTVPKSPYVDMSVKSGSLTNVNKGTGENISQDEIYVNESFHS